MIITVKKLFDKTGVNKAVFYFLASKVFNFIAAPVTFYLVILYLTPVEQGYYYTFTSFLALSFFFELGLGIVITMFASHECSQLAWKKDGSLTGDPNALGRLLSLLKKSLKWYGIITGLCIIGMIAAGLKFFGSKPEGYTLNYILPWILLVIFFGLGTALIPFTSVIEGSGRVSHVQRMRVVQSIAGIISVWLTIVLGGKLFSPTTEYATYWLVVVAWLFYKYPGLLKQIISQKIAENLQVRWFKEIFPMQWKIAVSSLAAYFANCIFVPLLFTYRGPVEAGKMGMSLKLSNIVYTLSIAWVATRVPLYGGFIRKKDYNGLDRLAIRSACQAILAGFIFSIIIFLILTLGSIYFREYKGRMLPEHIIAILCLSSLAIVFNSSIAGYLRAHKEEPLMITSIFLAMVTALACFISAKYFNANIMAIFYAGINIFIGIPLFLYVLHKKRKEWHGVSYPPSIIFDYRSGELDN